MTGPAYLAVLNPAQRQVVEFGVGPAGEGGPPLLVIAGAGTGKTQALAHRVAHIVVKGSAAARVLLLTFSRRAADEMARRAARIVTQAAGAAYLSRRESLSWCGTFHAVGARLLREYAARIGLNPDFTIHDRQDAADLLNLVRHEAGYSAQSTRFPAKGTCLAIYSATVNTRAPLSDVLQQRFPWCAQWEDALKHLFLAYVEAKQSQNVLDYDDLLLYWWQMMCEPSLAAEIGSRFDHVLVDEYQDTNRLQGAILLALKPVGTGLTVVGDDAQSIYSFRGATVRNILDFALHFDPPAQIVKLERNYRSTQAILGAANAVIALSSEGFDKRLWTEKAAAQRPQLVALRDEADQANFLVEQVLELRESGVRLKSLAVLFRASHHSARLEVELTRRNIPFVKFGGLKFLEAAHVKDALSLLRWIENPRDRVAGFRALQLMPGVGPKTAGRVLADLAGSARQIDALRAFDPPGNAAGAWPAFRDLIVALHERETGWPAEFEHVCGWYSEQMERLFEDARVRQGDLQQLERIAATFSSRERFLTELTLDPPQATSGEAGTPRKDEDYLILSTIHSAKGQEWTAVYLLNAVDGCLPSDLACDTRAQIEEERRLLYVAITRAKEHLYIIVPQRFYVGQQAAWGDRHVYAGRTRFIPSDLLELFETRAWPLRLEPAIEAGVSARQSAIDLSARMRDMWR